MVAWKMRILEESVAGEAERGFDVFESSGGGGEGSVIIVIMRLLKVITGGFWEMIRSWSVWRN